MKHLFFNEWKQKRVKKVIDVLGRNWFPGKTIHEFGCAHGEVGEEFLKIGAQVDFSDLREENFKDLYKRLDGMHYNPTVRVLDQEEKYNLNKKYDLLLHFGLLYNIKNWKQDLECAMSHSNMMFLESVVLPKEGKQESITLRISENAPMDEYVAGSREWSVKTQDLIESHLTDIGCKFIRFDDRDLNTIGWVNEKILGHNVYDWDYNDNIVKMIPRETYNEIFLHRRMWLVLR